MLDSVTIVFPGIPRGKERPRKRRDQDHFYTPRETEKYETAFGWAARAAMGARAPFTGAVEVEITAIFPVPKSWSKKRREAALAGYVLPTSKPDWENVAKCTDGLNKIVWNDDAQVTDGHVRKRYGDAPRLTITVRPIQLELPS